MEDTLAPQTAEDTKEKKVSKARDVWSVITRGELPFWWVDGTAFSDTSEAASEKRHKRLIEKLKKEEELLYAQNEELKEKLRADAAKFAEDVAAQNAEFARKEEEIKRYEAEQTAFYERTLIEAQEELEELKRDNELREMNNKALQRELQLKAEGDRQQQEISAKIDVVMSEVAAEKEKTANLDESFRALMEERDKLFPMTKDKSGGYLGFFEKKYEAFNPENMLEIKEISLFDNDEKKYVLHLPSLSVKKGRITVIQSYKQTLDLIERLLYRSTASSVHIHTGEIRFDGRVISSLARHEYKAMLGTEIISVNLTADEMLRSDKNMFSHFGLKKDDAAFIGLLDELQIEKRYRRAKCSDLPEEVLRIAALCYVVSRKPKLAVLEEPFNGLSEQYASRLKNFFNKKNLDLTALLLTQKQSVGLALRNSRLYVI